MGCLEEAVGRSDGHIGPRLGPSSNNQHHTDMTEVQNYNLPDAPGPTLQTRLGSDMSFFLAMTSPPLPNSLGKPYYRPPRRFAQAQHLPGAELDQFLNNGVRLFYLSLFHVERSFLCICIPISLPFLEPFTTCVVYIDGWIVMCYYSYLC